MATKKTWIWIIVGVVGVCVLSLFALAGAGVYFVSQHVQASRTTSADALSKFETTLATFKDQRALFELDSFDRVHSGRKITDMPTASIKPASLWILAWQPDRERLLQMSLPFWLLRLGHRKISLMAPDDRDFDLDRLNLDVPELERVGPVIVLDYRKATGEHVLVWTR